MVAALSCGGWDVSSTPDPGKSTSKYRGHYIGGHPALMVEMEDLRDWEIETDFPTPAWALYFHFSSSPSNYVVCLGLGKSGVNF